MLYVRVIKASLNLYFYECFNSDEKSNRKFRENKGDFQLLLGEMIGMYRRSRLPETLKPQLDGLEDKVSDQVCIYLYYPII
jgi:hypothetical protein